MERLTRKEAAEFLGCSRSALYKLEKTGCLKGLYYEIGTKRLYIKAKLQEWVEKGGEAQCEPQPCALSSLTPWKGETNGKSRLQRLHGGSASQ